MHLFFLFLNRQLGSYISKAAAQKKYQSNHGLNLHSCKFGARSVERNGLMDSTEIIRKAVTHIVPLLLVLGMGTVAAGPMSSWLEAQKKEQKISHAQAIEVAFKVAKEKFEGKGVGGGELDYDHVSVRREEEGWIVYIPEARPHTRPHGLTLSVGARTGEWKSVIVE